VAIPLKKPRKMLLFNLALGLTRTLRSPFIENDWRQEITPGILCRINQS
jgi:hypothetical protein